MRKLLYASLAAFALTLPVSAQSQVTLGAPFSDGMVIQRSQPIPVWGSAEPGSSISITLGSESRQAVAGEDGEWRADFPALDVGSALTLSASSGGVETAVSDIAIGDVFLCSGQSNMVWKMSLSALRPEDRNPPIDQSIRLLTVPWVSSQVEERSFGEGGRWSKASDDWLDFSAVCLFMGRSIAASEGVPVGLINASWGGTPIEAWLPAQGLAMAGGLDHRLAVLEDFRRDPVAAQAAHGPSLDDLWHSRPNPLRTVKGREGYANLFNGMIAPLGPTRFKGAVWYQGENNANNAAGTARYRTLLNSLIASWRGRLGKDLPFVVIQLAGYGKLSASSDEDDWAAIREAQRLVARDDPHTELVVTIDVGERLDIHPPLKKPVGLRSAGALRKLAYGKAQAYRPPEALTAHRSDGMIEIAISQASGPLFAASWGRPGPFMLCGDQGGQDCEFADAVFSANGIRVTVPDGLDPSLVRYCWDAAPICNVFDQEEIPLGPFELAIERTIEE